jgi:hypothetical protein
MMNFAKWTAILLVSATVSAQTATPGKLMRNSEPASKVTTTEVQALRDVLAQQQRAMAEQQRQIQQLREELARKDEGWRQTQQAASDLQTRLASVESKQDKGKDDQVVSTLKKDVDDIKGNMLNNAVLVQDEQKRVSGTEGMLNRFRFNGDVRVRYENFFQSFSGCVTPNCNPRHRERIRLRVGMEGTLSDDFSGGVYLATGALTDPVSTNETMGSFFARKAIGWDRGWITFKPHNHKWLEVTGGKFAYTWTRTAMTLDPDLNPEGFSQKLSFDLPNRHIKNVTFTGMQMIMSEVSKGADAFAAGGQVATVVNAGPVVLSPAFTVLNWRNTDSILSAISAKTLTGKDFYTNGTSPDGKHFLSRYLYADAILDATIRTPFPRFPARLVLDYVNNLNAVGNRRHGYWVETSFGRTKERGDFQVGYTFTRVEQDAVLAAFNESDLRAPTNVAQNRVQFQYQVMRNATLGYTAWLGRTLDRNLQNAAVPTGLGSSLTDPLLTRMQVDLIYKF